MEAEQTYIRHRRNRYKQILPTSRFSEKSSLNWCPTYFIVLDLNFT